MTLHSAILAALLIGSILVAGPASAEPGDDDTINSCLRAEQDAGRDMRHCVGRISTPCMKHPGGDTTVGMTMCLDRETKVWDALLNDEYRKLLAGLEAKAAKKIRTAQRAWIAMRDADCEVPYVIFEGGTIARPLSVQCMRDATADRALQLRSWREMTEN